MFLPLNPDIFFNISPANVPGAVQGLVPGGGAHSQRGGEDGRGEGSHLEVGTAREGRRDPTTE